MTLLILSLCLCELGVFQGEVQSKKIIVQDIAPTSGPDGPEALAALTKRMKEIVATVEKQGFENVDAVSIRSGEDTIKPFLKKNQLWFFPKKHEKHGPDAITIQYDAIAFDLVYIYSISLDEKSKEAVRKKRKSIDKEIAKKIIEIATKE